MDERGNTVAIIAALIFESDSFCFARLYQNIRQKKKVEFNSTDLEIKAKYKIT